MDFCEKNESSHKNEKCVRILIINTVFCAMRVNPTVRKNIALLSQEAACVLDAAASIMSPNGSFTHFPMALKVYGKDYEIGLRFLIEHKVVLVRGGLYRINRNALVWSPDADQSVAADLSM